jgi:hypothetical protein
VLPIFPGEREFTVPPFDKILWSFWKGPLLVEVKIYDKSHKEMACYKTIIPLGQ